MKIKQKIKRDIVVRKIEADIVVLNRKILDFKNGTLKVKIGKRKLKGELLENYTQLKINELEAEINRLEAILSSKISPKKYVSIIDKKTYISKKRKSKLPADLPYSPYYRFAYKKSRNETDLTNSLMQLERYDGTPTMFFSMEHREDKDYPCGGFSQKVKKGSSNSNEIQDLAIKVLKSNVYDGNTKHELRTAMRGAYCAQLLGGRGIAFRRDGKQYLVTDWHSGIPLSNADENSLANFTIKERIKLALDLINQVWILHNNGLIHGDIKPGNLIISNTSLKLIDLDSVRLKNEPPISGLPHSVPFIDSQLVLDLLTSDCAYQGFNEKSDIYALGLTLGFLFPELLDPTYSLTKITISNVPNRLLEHPAVHLRYGDKYHEHKELADIIIKCREPNKAYRPDSCAEIFRDIRDIFCQNYKTDKNEPAPKLTPATLKTRGKEAFKQIERELYEYNKKLNHWESTPLRPYI